jgi:hypothetical protein
MRWEFKNQFYIYKYSYTLYSLCGNKHYTLPSLRYEYIYASYFAFSCKDLMVFFSLFFLFKKIV